MYLSTIADATTFRKVALMLLANARANNVLPVPGGLSQEEDEGQIKVRI